MVISGVISPLIWVIIIDTLLIPNEHNTYPLIKEYNLNYRGLNIMI